MDLKLLRAFLTVAELRHFGRAADALHTSQPALSKQIGALETSLGARLFERGRHGAELTTFGADFLPDAAALIRDADDMLLRAKEASGGKRGRLRVGLCLSVLTIAPRWIAEFRGLHPNVNVTLVDLSSAEQTRRLLAGTLDVGFMRMQKSEALAGLPIVEESLALAIPQSARIKRLPTDLNVLNDIGFVTLTRARQAGTADQVDRWCAQRGFVPRIVQEVQDVQSVLATVAAGVGVAFVPSRMRFLLRDATVLALPGAHARWRVGLVWQAGRDDVVTQRFVAFARAALKRERAA
ncbi:LysR family transcriptional regulator [Trinickia acidisoli]|uniref:LysR family transcriptional regulator n=1 Tax=Trinickia acidisoli TaxID=2767482 RepID=UPI001A8F75FD|nr:LysR substrate-binding domain-containing protein [Trinickia acidisoli]